MGKQDKSEQRGVADARNVVFWISLLRPIYLQSVDINLHKQSLNSSRFCTYKFLLSEIVRMFSHLSRIPF